MSEVLKLYWVLIYFFLYPSFQTYTTYSYLSALSHQFLHHILLSFLNRHFSNTPISTTYDLDVRSSDPQANAHISLTSPYSHSCFPILFLKLLKFSCPATISLPPCLICYDPSLRLLPRYGLDIYSTFFLTFILMQIQLSPSISFP